MLLVQSSHRNTTIIVSSIVWKVFREELLLLVVVCAAVYESVLLTDCYVLPWCLVPLGAVCVNRVFSNTLSGENDSVNECFHDLCASYGSRCFFSNYT